MRVTPDTNVLVSALFYNGNERRILKAAIEQRLVLILSLDIIDELARVLDEKFELDSEDVAGYALRLGEIAEIVEPRGLPELRIRDRDDLKIVACVISGKSDYIVTGDQDLLELKQYRSIRIVPASGLLLKLNHKSRHR